MFRAIHTLLLAALLLVSTLLVMTTGTAAACPFCSAVSQTLTEQIETSDVAVLGELIDLPAKLEDGPEQPLFDEAIEASKATFRIDTVYRGQEELGDAKDFKALYLSEKEPGEKFLVLGRKQLSPGSGEPEVEWGAPIWLSTRSQNYLKKVLALPSGKDKAHERLAFFEDYLQDEESLLRADAFDEFARADYDVLKGMKDQIDRPRLLRWIADPEVSRSRRRLYFTMLGVCGTVEDVKLLEEMLRSEKESDWQALDALVACYLTLSGEAGMPLIENDFLKKSDLEYVPLFAVTMALRFHGEQGDIIPRQRIIEAMRYVLERKDLADLVITDLARWKDWESMDRLAQLFYDVDEDTFFIRMAVVKYMRVCPLPEAKVHMAEFAKVDPKVVKRATMTWPGLTPVKPQSDEKVEAGEKDEADEKREAGDDKGSADDAKADGDETAAVDRHVGATATIRPVAYTTTIAQTTAAASAPASTTAAAPVPVLAAAGEGADTNTTMLRLVVLAVAAACAGLLLLAFRLILRGHSEPRV